MKIKLKLKITIIIIILNRFSARNAIKFWNFLSLMNMRIVVLIDWFYVIYAEKCTLKILCNFIMSAVPIKIIPYKIIIPIIQIIIILIRILINEDSLKNKFLIKK